MKWQRRSPESEQSVTTEPALRQTTQGTPKDKQPTTSCPPHWQESKDRTWKLIVDVEAEKEEEVADTIETDKVLPLTATSVRGNKLTIFSVHPRKQSFFQQLLRSESRKLPPKSCMLCRNLGFPAHASAECRKSSGSDAGIRDGAWLRN
jgi:hypothetical protein